MKNDFLHKKFIFNDNIDSEFLFSLYEDDFLYIEEIFKTTLDQLNTAVDELPPAFTGNDVGTLKRIVHKIKPAFGFTGFLSTEKACKEFEDACSEGIQATDLADLYHPLWSVLIQSIDIMKNQHDQLKEFNKP